MSLFFGKRVYPDTRTITDDGTRQWAKSLTLSLDDILRLISDEFNRFVLTGGETDPIFTAWDKSDGISITESQISDFGTYLESETDPVFAASAAYNITNDIDGNMVFTDAVVGSRTLKQLGCPTYKYLKATNQSAGDIHLSGATWAVSKSHIISIKVVTISTGWSLSLVQNDNGYATNDADYPLVTWGTFDGNAIIKVNDCYEDEDDSDEVHLYYDGASPADIYIKAIELL